MRAGAGGDGRGPPFVGDERAASFQVGILVALAIVGGAFLFGFVAYDGPSAEPARRAELAARAEGALLVLLQSAGQPHDWHRLAPADVQRIGLLPFDGAPPRLDAAKLARLRGTEDAPFPNEEMRRALGVAGAAEGGFFHMRLRVEPVFHPHANGTVAELRDVRTAYVADHAGGAMTAVAATEREHLRKMALAFDRVIASEDPVTYRGRGTVFRDDDESLRRELPPRLAGFESVSYTGAVTSDPSLWKVVRRGEYGNADWWTATTPPRLLTIGKLLPSAHVFTLSNVRTHSITLGAFDLRDHGPGAAATLELHHWVKPGTNGVLLHDKASIVARCVANCTGVPTDTEVWARANGVPLGTKGEFERTLVSLDVPPQDFVGTEFTLRLVYATSNPGVGFTPGEGWFIAYLALNATKAPSAGGAASTLYENRMDFRTSRYDALVVGSDVDQASAFADRFVQVAVQDWVEGGGRLLALGSNHASSAWLAPALTDDTGSHPPWPGLLDGRSDYSHPLLTSPHRLAPASHAYAEQTYAPNGRLMTVLIGDAGTMTLPVTSVTRPHDPAPGAAILTSARPGGFEHDGEAFRALVDWMAYLVGDELHLERGDSVPPHQDFGHARAAAWLDGGDRTVAVTVFVWN